MSRFDYVKYDETSVAWSETMKNKVEELEAFALTALNRSRERSCFLTALEEAFMWFGKALKVDQEKRDEDGEEEG